MFFQKIFRFSATTLCVATAFSVSAQTPDTIISSIQELNLEAITVSAKSVTLATDKMPITRSDLNAQFIQRNNLGQDVPYLLRLTPSLVETSDAGNGIGYTGLRIRGTDVTRINVTIDGIPLNDSESHGVFWVNMPDFSSSTTGIQIQRGVGTSTNGAAAFGATVNLSTNQILKDKSLEYSTGYGSFNSFKNTLNVSSGVLKNKFYLEGRASQISSDGYVDRASSDLKSWYVAGTYFTNKSSLKLKAFGGNEKTYQAYYGVPIAYLTNKTLRTFNSAGTEKADSPYDNQVDDYSQNHFHALFNHRFSKHLKGNISGHYTRGLGFYEEYKADQKLKNYDYNTPDSVRADLVRRLWLDNHFYGTIYSLTFNNQRTESTLGGAYNEYKGDHYGDVLQVVDNANRKGQRFYFNESFKSDFNIFSKTTYQLTPQLNGYLDLQYRQIHYTMQGETRKVANLDQDLTYRFFNPKIGLNYDVNKQNRLYAFFAITNREPNRDDIVDRQEGNGVRNAQAERLYDTEIGYKLQTQTASVGINGYLMQYDNQLAVTGAINDVGSQIRVNVPKSYRAGVELEANVNFFKKLDIRSNATFSQNKVLNFTEYIDNFDTGGQDSIKRGTTNLAFSPNLIFNTEIAYKVLEKTNGTLSVAVANKLVGKQYLDNTSNPNATLPRYNQTDIKILYNFKYKALKEATFRLSVNNIFDNKFSNNGYAYRFVSAGYDVSQDPYAVRESGNVINSLGYYPQAGINFISGLTVKF